MDSNKVEAVSKRSQAYIFIKQGYFVRDTAQLIRQSRFFFVQKWSKRGKNGTFERKKRAAEDLLKFQVKFILPLKSLSTSAINLQESSVETFRTYCVHIFCALLFKKEFWTQSIQK